MDFAVRCYVFIVDTGPANKGQNTSAFESRKHMDCPSEYCSCLTRQLPSRMTLSIASLCMYLSLFALSYSLILASPYPSDLAEFSSLPPVLPFLPIPLSSHLKMTKYHLQP
ncbi:hypothetical protein DL98DRAFT_518608 [Cadophora sp. DSE1049]|nr:hypothetical protein DL98DRAFT_518608 [Cadophora sp. DSE1049]